MRTEICLRPFNNPEYQVKKGDFPMTYYNKYYQKNMDLKVTDFYWPCSRKSYLPCGQTSDLCSMDAILLCLKSGARLLNLDIYSDTQSAKPVIRNKTLMPYYGVPLEVDETFKQIKTNAWKDNSRYPLILYLTVNTEDPSIMDQIYELLIKHFNGKFINKKYSFNGRDGKYPLSQVTIKEFQGNVAVITDKYPLTGKLNELINGVVSPTQEYINQHIYSPEDENYGGIIVKTSDTESLVNHNRTYLTLVESEGTNSLANVHNPKSDLYNPPPKDCWKFGCQWVLMNYQLFDNNMNTYLKKFQNSSLVLKPEALRYVPKPPPKVNDQHPRNYYAPRKLERPGWFSVNV